MTNEATLESSGVRRSSHTIAPRVATAAALLGCAAALVASLARDRRRSSSDGSQHAAAEVAPPPCSTCGRWSAEFTPDPLDSPALQLIARELHGLAFDVDDWGARDVSWVSSIVEDPLRSVPGLPAGEADRASALGLRTVTKRLRDNVPGETWSPMMAEHVSQWLASPRDVVRYGALLVYFEARHGKPEPDSLAELKQASDPLIAATARAVERAP
ncbi:MAG: hypothetical protein IT439_06525 [Phycisphaerales bacterium]|nr:hypothetical protein [Phycisphaerales bacterium]